MMWLLAVLGAQADWALTTSYDRVVYAGDAAWYGMHGVQLTASRSLPEDLRIDVGVRGLQGRWLPHTLGAELWTAVAVEPRWRRLQPSLGLELGVTTATDLDWPQIYGAGWEEGPAVPELDVVPIWVGLRASPVRLVLGRWQLGIAEVGVGALGGAHILRAQLTPVSLGWTW